MKRGVMNRLTIVAILGLLFQGCVSTLRLDPMALDGQHKVRQDGAESIISTKKALVAIRPGAEAYSSERRPTIVVTVLNSTEEPFSFSIDDVQVFVDGEPHKVLTYDEAVAEVKPEQAGETIAAALRAIMLKNATVLPHAWHEGYVTIEKIPHAAHPHDIRVVITAAGEEHEFLLKHFKERG